MLFEKRTIITDLSKGEIVADIIATYDKNGKLFSHKYSYNSFYEVKFNKKNLKKKGDRWYFKV